MKKYLTDKLEERKKNDSFRELKKQGGLVDFCSNDYLGLAKGGEDQAIKNISHGATGSRLISGNSSLMEIAERKIAAFHKADSGLIFNSGYVANLGLLSCVPQRGDTILFDELAHASIRDGIRLSNATAWSFKHSDCGDLKEKIQRANGTIYIVVESVYSMDGDCAPLKKILAICQDYQAELIVDEAHAVGVFGSGRNKNGEGLVVSQGIENQVFARIITFGKSIGAHGAIVLGSTALRDYLINFCRPFIYTTALPDSTIQSVLSNYKRMQNGNAILLLKERISFFKEWQKKSKIEDFLESESAIQSLLIKGNSAAKLLSQKLKNMGLDVRAILHPTIPKGKERLRITLHAFNNLTDLEKLFKVLERHCTTTKKIQDIL